MRGAKNDSQQISDVSEKLEVGGSTALTTKSVKLKEVGR